MGAVVLVTLASLAALAWVVPPALRAGQGSWLFTLLLSAPVLEECFFRGVLHDGLLRLIERRRLAARRAALAAHGVNVALALLFALLHGWARSPALGLAVMLPALLIGRVYQRRRRVLEAALLHALFNLGWLALAQGDWPAIRWLLG